MQITQTRFRDLRGNAQSRILGEVDEVTPTARVFTAKGKKRTLGTAVAEHRVDIWGNRYILVNINATTEAVNQQLVETVRENLAYLHRRIIFSYGN